MIEVTIRLKPQNVLPDVFDWLFEQDLDHMRDWTWDSPALGTEWAKQGYTHIFKFNKAEDATMFALRWA